MPTIKGANSYKLIFLKIGNFSRYRSLEQIPPYLLNMIFELFNTQKKQFMYISYTANSGQLTLQHSWTTEPVLSHV